MKVQLIAYLLIAGAVPMAAQTTFATITGVVTDPAGMTIAGAAITATHTQSNYRYTAQSNETGTYTLAQLREGEYTLQTQAAGFKEFVMRAVQLVALDVRRIDVKMELGAV